MNKPIENLPGNGLSEMSANNPVVTETYNSNKGIEVSVGLLNNLNQKFSHFHISRDQELLAVLDEGAKQLNIALLPNNQAPLDRLHGVFENHQIGPELELSMSVGDFLSIEPHTHRFAIELVLAIQINTRWRIAPEEEMTPKSILELASLSWEEYSLYSPPESVDPLPPDTPVKLARGMRFEAQRDGKYGDSFQHAHHKS